MSQGFSVFPVRKALLKAPPGHCTSITLSRQTKDAQGDYADTKKNERTRAVGTTQSRRTTEAGNNHQHANNNVQQM